jgi:hypothetical protein
MGPVIIHKQSLCTLHKSSPIARCPTQFHQYTPLFSHTPQAQNKRKTSVISLRFIFELHLLQPLPESSIIVIIIIIIIIIVVVNHHRHHQHH